MDRASLIEDEFLEGAGFRRTANVQFRKTNGKEKALSIAQGIVHAFSFGAVPQRPYLEVDYARLPTGTYYSFDAVIAASEFNKVSPDVRTILELEYMLHVEFSGGIVGQHNSAYYTEDNIKKFQELAQRLPNSPDSVSRVKNRYLDTGLKKIQSAFERHKNPSPDTLRALQNLKPTLQNL